MAYLDVMAGSGLNQIRESGDLIAGSSVLAASVPTKPFDFIVSIEKDRRRAAALNLRLAALRAPETFRVVADEADAVISGVIQDLDARGAHFLAFVDYEGIKGFSWQSMDLLLRSPCDLWFTFFPGTKRAWEQNRETCRELFGALVDTADDYDDLLNRWVSHLRTLRDIMYVYTIDGGEGYHYYLIFLTRRTRTGSRYTKAADDLTRRLSQVDATFAQTILDVMRHGQQTFDRGWPI